MLQAEPGLDVTLRSIVAAAVINIPGADFAVITLVSPSGEVSTPAVSEPLVAQVEDLQNQTNQGPCLSSAWKHITVRTNDLRTEQRWPLVARRAADLGVRSMPSFQLYVRDGGIGTHLTSTDGSRTHSTMTTRRSVCCSPAPPPSP